MNESWLYTVYCGRRAYTPSALPVVLCAGTRARVTTPSNFVSTSTPPMLSFTVDVTFRSASPKATSGMVTTHKAVGTSCVNSVQLPTTPSTSKRTAAPSGLQARRPILSATLYMTVTVESSLYANGVFTIC